MPGATIPQSIILYLEKPLKHWEREIDVLNAESGITLYVGQSATIEKNILHCYYQVGAKEIIVELVKSAYVPANINFERSMKIIRGFHKDGSTHNRTFPTSTISPLSSQSPN